MRSYILLQPDQKYAVFSATTDDFTYVGMTGHEALSWGIKQWGARIGAERFASASADEAIGLNSGSSSDGLSRWRFSLTNIAAAYGIQYLLTTLSEIGFPESEIPKSAVTGVNFDVATTLSNVVHFKRPEAPTDNDDRAELSAYLLKVSLGLREDGEPRQ